MSLKVFLKDLLRVFEGFFTGKCKLTLETPFSGSFSKPLLKNLGHLSLGTIHLQSPL